MLDTPLHGFERRRGTFGEEGRTAKWKLHPAEAPDRCMGERPQLGGWEGWLLPSFLIDSWGGSSGVPGGGDDKYCRVWPLSLPSRTICGSESRLRSFALPAANGSDLRRGKGHVPSFSRTQQGSPGDLSDNCTTCDESGPNSEEGQSLLSPNGPRPLMGRQGEKHGRAVDRCGFARAARSPWRGSRLRS